MTIKQQMSTLNSRPGDNPVNWLWMMTELYQRLIDADLLFMSDAKFTKLIITLIANDEKWRYCKDKLRERLCVGEAVGRSLLSMSVIAMLKSEEIDLGIFLGIKAMHMLVQSRKGK